MSGATTTSGQHATTDRPIWFPMLEPTQEQINASAEIGHRYFHRRLRKWYVWLKITSNQYHLGFTSGGRDDIDMSETGKDVKHKIPSIHERAEMREAGVKAIDNFMSSLTFGDDGKYIEARADVWLRIEPILSVIRTGDMPAAIVIAKNLDISASAGQGDIAYNQKQRLIEALEEEMIYFPDYQAADSKSADRTIKHYTPTPLNTNSGTNSGTNVSVETT